MGIRKRERSRKTGLLVAIPEEKRKIGKAGLLVAIPERELAKTQAKCSNGPVSGDRPLRVVVQNWLAGDKARKKEKF